MTANTHCVIAAALWTCTENPRTHTDQRTARRSSALGLCSDGFVAYPVLMPDLHEDSRALLAIF